MKRSWRKGSVYLLTVVSIILMPGLEAQDHSRRQGFEKEGRFIAPDQGISLSRSHAKVSSYDGPQPFDVLHYDLQLRLPLTNDSLSGSNTMTLRLKQAVDSLVLHGVGLALDTVLVNGQSRNVTLNTPAETFTIHLGSVQPAGDTLTIRMAYVRIPGYPRPGSRRGYYFFLDTLGIPSNLGYTFSEPSDARLWMPCYDEPWEKATARISITVPDGYVAASNGRLVSSSGNGDGTTTWRWNEEHQITTYLMCITASEFTVSTLPYVTATGDTIPLQYYVWPADSADCATYLPTLRGMTEAFVGMFGEYPFAKYGMTAIVPFVYLGMEHQTITTMNRFYRTNTRVVAHELAHQWWGDLVTCGTWPDIWLNESFATYSEALYREHLGGFPALRSYMKDTLEHFFFGSWQGAVYNPVAQGFNLFDDVVYSKGAWVLHTLRGVVGDSVFFGIFRAYRERFAGKSAITSELESVVDSVVGSDMGWFFDQWIYGRGWPRYASSYIWAQDTLRLTLYQLQSSSWPTYKMPIKIRAHTSGASTDFWIRDSLRTQVFMLPLGVRPDSVIIDPDNWILKQVTAPPVSVGEADRPLFSFLDQNFPNPFNPATTIRYAVGTSNHTSLRVYDILGREVETLVDEVKDPGEYSVLLDAGGFAGGVYFYRIIAGSFQETRRLIILK